MQFVVYFSKMGRKLKLFMKIDKTVIKETEYIAIFVGVFSVIMQIVYLCIGYWDYTILLGNLWGAALAIGNHFAMGLFIQKAVAQEPDEAKKTVKNSMSIRFGVLLILMIIGMVIPIFNPIAIAIPLIFPSLAIYLRPLVDKFKK